MSGSIHVENSAGLCAQYPKRLTMTLSNQWKTSFIGLLIAMAGCSSVAVSAFSTTNSRGGRTVVAPSYSTQQRQSYYTSCIIPSSYSSSSSSLSFRLSINNDASSDAANNNNNIDSVWHEALLTTPAESILPIVIDHNMDYGPVNHELRMALLSLDSPTLVEEENNNVVDFTEAGLKEAAKHFIPVALEFGVIAVVADVATNVWN
jgi:hypothetical protein